MKSQNDYLEFVVTSLEEIKTLLDVWDGIAGAVFRREDSNIQRALKLAGYAMVGIDVDRAPDPNREVYLIFTAPRTMVERLFKTLRRKGLNFNKEVDEEESIIRGRLIPAASQS